VVIAGQTAAADLARLPEEVSHGVSHLGVISHTAAFRDGGDWLDVVIGALDERRKLLGRLIEGHLPGVRWTPPEGTYLAWLDCRALPLYRRGISLGIRGNVRVSDGLAKAFLDGGRVLLSSGSAFGGGGEGFVRLNFATSPAVLSEALRRMGTVVATAS
jgi:cystathionine beta-lyase